MAKNLSGSSLCPIANLGRYLTVHWWRKAALSAPLRAMLPARLYPFWPHLGRAGPPGPRFYRFSGQLILALQSGRQLWRSSKILTAGKAEPITARASVMAAARAFEPAVYADRIRRGRLATAQTLIQIDLLQIKSYCVFKHGDIWDNAHCVFEPLINLPGNDYA